MVKALPRLLCGILVVLSILGRVSRTKQQRLASTLKETKNATLMPLTAEESTSTWSHDAVPDPVKWVYDEDWFSSVFPKVKQDCCPYAERMQPRTAVMAHQCCLGREKELLPLRAIGGVSDWEFLLRDDSAHKRILFQGDSLARQHILGLLCYDYWDSRRLLWSWSQEPTGLWTAQHVQHNISLHFWEERQPNATSPVGYASFDFVILGGWHHFNSKGGAAIKLLVRSVQALRPKSPISTTLISEALPNHFPGGKHLPPTSGETYPLVNLSVPASAIQKTTVQLQKNHSQPQHAHYNRYAGLQQDTSPLICDLYAKETGTPPQVNENLELWMKQLQEEDAAPVATPIIRVAQLYRHRGAAHLHNTTNQHGEYVRDCLHWCLLPGVLDAWARATLATLFMAVKKQRADEAMLPKSSKIDREERVG